MGKTHQNTLDELQKALENFRDFVGTTPIQHESEIVLKGTILVEFQKLEGLFSAFQELSLAAPSKERSLRKLLLDSPELLEELASLEHQQWSMLMAYIKSVSIEERDIVEQLQSKWKEWRQLANTPYANLTEKQKESDRMFARDMLKILKERVFDEEVSGVEEK